MQWRAVHLWPQIVGESIAKIAVPRYVMNGTLFVGTASSAWANELDFRKPEILSLIHKHLGEESIRDLRFQSISWKKEEADFKPRKPAKLTPSEMIQIHKLTERIENVKVRKAFEKVLIQDVLRSRESGKL